MMHPVGLGLLGLSLVLALAVAVLPPLYPWSGRSGWLVVLGLLAYVGTILASRLFPAHEAPSRAEVRTLLRIKERINARLRRLRESDARTRRPELESALEDAVRQIDGLILPALQDILEREGDMARHLHDYDAGLIPLPERPLLDRLNEIHQRQRSAIDACVQQAANAEATLEAILQESNDARVSQRARAWVGDLLILHDALRDVIQEDGEWDATDQDGQVPEHDGHVLAPASAPIESSDFVGLLEEALRRLNNLGLLAQCGLMQRLPWTLRYALHDRLNGQATEASPLELANALHTTLIGAIDRLKPPDRQDAAAPESLQYHIIHDEYVADRATKDIMLRYNISESTLHRYRRQAIEVIAGDLMKQEQRVSRASGGVA